MPVDRGSLLVEFSADEPVGGSVLLLGHDNMPLGRCWLARVYERGVTAEQLVGLSLGPKKKYRGFDGKDYEVVEGMRVRSETDPSCASVVLRDLDETTIRGFTFSFDDANDSELSRLTDLLGHHPMYVPYVTAQRLSAASELEN